MKPDQYTNKILIIWTMTLVGSLVLKEPGIFFAAGFGTIFVVAGEVAKDFIEKLLAN